MPLPFWRLPLSVAAALTGLAPILDGGLAAWKADGGPTTTAVPPPVRRTLTVHPRDDVVVYTLIDDNGAFKSPAALEKALDAAGATAGKRVISYCRSCRSRPAAADLC